MSKREKFYSELFPSGEIRWPDGDSGENIAAELFGAVMFGCVDTNIKDALDVVAGAATEYASTDHSALQSALVDLSDSEKEAVSALVKRVATGILYWMCVKIDQFPGSDVEITLIDKSGQRRTIAAPSKRELRMRYFEWMDSFSDYAE